MTRKRKLNPYGNLLFHLEIKNHWTPKVIDYEDEELRNRLGPYGIWGHYLEELYIESIRYNQETKTVHMFIGL